MSGLVKELVIDRAKWRRGDGGGVVLLDERGCGCVLGHLLDACGVARELLALHEVPSSPPVSRVLSTSFRYLVIRARMSSVGNSALRYLVIQARSSVGNSACSHFTCCALDLNDDAELADVVRERHLINLFGEQRIALHFVGEGRPT